MKKVIIKMGYRQLVLDQEVGLALFKIMDGVTIEDLESRFELDYKKNIFYVKPVINNFLTITSVPDEHYAMWKLAGEEL